MGGDMLLLTFSMAFTYSLCGHVFQFDGLEWQSYVTTEQALYNCTSQSNTCGHCTAFMPDV